MCSTYGSSARCHGNACRINGALILVFKRGYILLLLGMVFSLSSIFLANSEVKLLQMDFGNPGHLINIEFSYNLISYNKHVLYENQIA